MRLSYILMVVFFHVSESRYSYFMHKESTPLKTTGYMPLRNITCETKVQCAVKCTFSTGCVLVDLIAKVIYRPGKGGVDRTELKRYLLSKNTFDQGKNSKVKRNSSDHENKPLKETPSPLNQEKTSLKIIPLNAGQEKKSLKGPLPHQRDYTSFFMVVLGNHMPVRGIVVGSIFSMKVNDTGIKSTKNVKAFLYDPGTGATFWSMAGIRSLGHGPGIYKRALRRKARWVKWLNNECETSYLYVFSDKLYFVCGMVGAIYSHTTLKRSQKITEWHKKSKASVEKMSGNENLLCWVELSHRRRFLFCSQLPTKNAEYIAERPPATSMSVLKVSDRIITAAGRFRYGQPSMLSITQYDSTTKKQLCDREVDVYCMSYIQSVGIYGNLVYNTCEGTNTLEARKIDIEKCNLDMKPKVTVFPAKPKFSRFERITFSFL